MAFVVFLIENLFGGPLARKLAFRLVNPKKDKEFFIILAIQIMTVCTMCPSMSLVASILFKGALKGHFLAIWIQTVAINFPMALIWQIFICGPLDRLFYRKVMLPVSNLIVSFGKEKTF